MNELHHLVARKKALLGMILSDPMQWLADNAFSVWDQPGRLDWVLQDAFSVLPYCHLLYALDCNGVQLSSNVQPDGVNTASRGQELSHRPYLDGSLPYQGFILSKAYVSRDRFVPCLTAVQAVRRGEDLLGFIAADFDIAALPATSGPRRADGRSLQFQGDPAIRSAVFGQSRARTVIDERAEEVVAIVTALMRYHGVFHSKLHFSSSRTTLWHMDEPCSYRVHGAEEIVDPEVCLTYARRPYPVRATFPADQVRAVLEQFIALRNADETIYLRSGSLNVVNGMVGLTFSCDGTHYVRADRFVRQRADYWLGTVAQTPAPPASAAQSALASAVQLRP